MKNDWVSIKSIRTDNGTRFVGTDNGLKRGFKKLYHTRIKHILHKNGTDWLVLTRNTPVFSHIGGAWEQQMQSGRTILSSLLKTHGASL